MRTASPPRGGTTYLCAVDGERNAVSLIQSTYEHFGSGVVAGDTGIVLQNRGACFVETEGHPNRLAPAKRPFHTIIPGMLLRDGALWGLFGVMGGAMQARRTQQVALEPGLWIDAPELRELGRELELTENEHGFGVGQCVLVGGEARVGGSDGRGDGHVSGL